MMRTQPTRTAVNNLETSIDMFPELSRTEKIHRMRISNISGIGPVTFQKLIDDYGSAEKALENHDFKNKKVINIKDIETNLKQTQTFGAHTLIWGDKQYPRYLYELSDAPPVLYAKGNINLLQAPTIGIVGARNASASGHKITSNIAAELGKAGYIVASGLARGIDTSAHKASIKTGTIACVAGGIDMPYPPENTDLFDQIIRHGVIISEMPLGTQPQARHFPRRNRLIAGLSIGVVVIEAAQKSGSLITAKLAADYGRDVFAVPGSPLDPRAHGTNQLIKDGAILTRSAEDILDTQSALPNTMLKNMDRRPLIDITDDETSRIEEEEAPSTSAPPSHSVQSSENIVLELLSLEPVHIDEIIRRSNLSVHIATAIITTLEIEGKIIKHSGGRISLSP
ncbi:DNA-processing protein DprA [Kordiimonas sp. SCSIO 12610]|uniref:DNA-processing protein DprA n=1 Tax=Kordiimonas sp. SCSIO 12610 TaxID=2829597 RepID=UPI00210D2592|nr:DNA-processing protein DprA [Kordiimonas sp. SCSIO 12610]UTW54255.1 DNA-processing protein DprA [Kordiimonas sp. SCSIO 12610]